jgi:hypothetical protein
VYCCILIFGLLAILTLGFAFKACIPPTDKVLHTNTANKTRQTSICKKVSPLSIKTEIRHYRMLKIINRFTCLAKIRRHNNLPTYPEQITQKWNLKSNPGHAHITTVWTIWYDEKEYEESKLVLACHGRVQVTSINIGLHRATQSSPTPRLCQVPRRFCCIQT